MVSAADFLFRFCKILDSPKTGYNIKPETRIADARDYSHARGPAWKNRQKQVTGSALNSLCLERKIDPSNPMLARPFIMDILNAAATSQENTWLRDAEELFRPLENLEVVLDSDLAKPWQDFTDHMARRVRKGDMDPKADQKIIAEHVREMYQRHSRDIKSTGHSQTHGFTGRAIEVRQDTLRTLSRDFAASPTPEQLKTIFDSAAIARLRASYAYIYDHEKSKKYKSNGGWSRFPWDVALGGIDSELSTGIIMIELTRITADLCRIKAAALGPHKAVTINFYERFKLGGDRRR
jgi:hypothetical protein